MKKIFDKNGYYYGVAENTEKKNNDVLVTFPGDFPGMATRTIIFLSASIIYEDADRIYIEYK